MINFIFFTLHFDIGLIQMALFIAAATARGQMKEPTYTREM